MRIGEGRDAGFTLVEVLVALVVVSLLVTVTASSAVLARDRAKQANARREAVIVARSIVDRLASEAYRPGESSGVVGNVVWQARETAVTISPQRNFVLAGIRVVVRNAKGVAVLSVATQRIVPLAAT